MRTLLLVLLLAAAVPLLSGCSGAHMRMHRYRIEKTMEREVHPDIDLLLVI